MALGPGKYDDLATLVRERAQARGAIVIVVDGALGSGFSVQADLLLTMTLPALLRAVAAQIEEETGGTRNRR